MLATTLATLALAAGSTSAGASAGPYDDDPDPLRALLLPPVDSVISLFLPFPLPPTPPTGDICPDGADACIDEVVVRMEERLDDLVATCSHSAIFSLAYLRVTENVRDAVRSDYFDDAGWLNRLDAVFAEMYFDTVAAWDHGDRATVPMSWRIALQAEEDRAMSGLGNFLLSMNAHINSDFPRALAAVGLTGPGGSHKRDHDRYNNRLDSLYAGVFAEEAARFDPTFDDIDAGSAEEAVAGVIMRGWREMVWRHAEALTVARKPAARRLVEREIEAYATLQGQLIRAVFVADSTERDRWCATHGRG